MNPWDIIGWAIVFAIVGPVVLGLLVYTRYRLSILIRHYLTYRTPPAAGQRWRQGTSTLTIDRIADNGRIVIKSGNASWSDSPEDWRVRVSRRHVYLAS